jgi:hypothetical protein
MVLTGSEICIAVRPTEPGAGSQQEPVAGDMDDSISI